jgi:ankyrin repeat protein
LDNIFGERLSASEKEKLDEIKAYLQTYDAIKLKNGDFIKYPLHKAVREGREKIDDIRFLCEYGANILSYSYSGMQPLHYLPYLSDEASAVEIAAILYGHSFNLMASPTRSCIMPLTLAIEAKKFVLANKFIELGAPVNLEPDSTQQPLLLAIKSGNEGLVDTLLAMGANPLNSDTLEYLNTIDDSSPKARQYVRTIKSKLRKAMLNQIQAME